MKRPRHRPRRHRLCGFGLSHPRHATRSTRSASRATRWSLAAASRATRVSSAIRFEGRSTGPGRPVNGVHRRHRTIPARHSARRPDGADRLHRRLAIRRSPGTRRRVVPYVGGGAGVLLYRESDEFAEDDEEIDDTFMSYHVLGGVDVYLQRRFAIRAEFRYRAVPAPSATVAPRRHRRHVTRRGGVLRRRGVRTIAAPVPRAYRWPSWI